MHTRPATTIPIDFSGARSGVGPATWGQWAVRNAMLDVAPHDHGFNLCLDLVLDRPVQRDPAVRAVRWLLDLHDSLHTRIRTGPDRSMRQHVDGDGRLDLHWVEADGPAAVAAARAELATALVQVSFDPEREWPLRVGLIGAGDQVAAIVLVVCHTATDGMGMGLLRGDLTALLAGADPAELRRRYRFQPLHEAAYQTSDRGRQRDRAARRHWRDGLTAAPGRMFAPVHSGTRAFRRATLVSPALPPALAVLAGRWRLPPAALLLAAAAAAVAEESGSRHCAFQVMVSNRFVPSLRHLLSPVTLEGLFTMDTEAAGLELLARRAHAASIRTYYHSYYDKAALNRDLDRLVAGRGEDFDRTCWFNDLRDLVPQVRSSAPPQRPGAAPARSTLTWSGPLDDHGDVAVAWHLYQRPGAMPVVLTINTALLDLAAGERMLTGMEARILGAARVA